MILGIQTVIWLVRNTKEVNPDGVKKKKTVRFGLISTVQKTKIWIDSKKVRCEKISL